MCIKESWRQRVYGDMKYTCPVINLKRSKLIFGGEEYEETASLEN